MTLTASGSSRSSRPMASIESSSSSSSAVRLFTRGGSLIANLEDKKGSLEPGMQADFAAYDDDPLTAESIEGLRPVLTVSMGREVFAR